MQWPIGSAGPGGLGSADGPGGPSVKRSRSAPPGAPRPKTASAFGNSAAAAKQRPTGSDAARGRANDQSAPRRSQSLQPTTGHRMRGIAQLRSNQVTPASVSFNAGNLSSRSSYASPSGKSVFSPSVQSARGPGSARSGLSGGSPKPNFMSPTRASFFMGPMAALSQMGNMSSNMPDVRPNQRDQSTQTQRGKVAPLSVQVSEEDREWWMIEAQRMIDDLNKLREERTRLFDVKEDEQAEYRRLSYELGRISTAADRQYEQYKVADDMVKRLRDEANAITLEVDTVRMENRRATEEVMYLEDQVRGLEGRILKEAILQENSKQMAVRESNIRKAKRQERRAREAKRRAKEENVPTKSEEKKMQRKAENVEKRTNSEDEVSVRKSSTEQATKEEQQEKLRSGVQKDQT